jgi:hypothetical protein
VPRQRPFPQRSALDRRCKHRFASSVIDHQICDCRFKLSWHSEAPSASSSAYKTVKRLEMPLLSVTLAYVATYSRADIDAVIDESRGRLERAKAGLQSIAHTILESLRLLETSERKLRDLESRSAMSFRLD